jgi:hypothetical protein
MRRASYFRRVAFCAGVVAAVAVVFAALGGSAHARVPGSNGLIAFVRSNNNTQTDTTYIVNPERNSMRKMRRSETEKPWSARNVLIAPYTCSASSALDAPGMKNSGTRPSLHVPPAPSPGQSMSRVRSVPAAISGFARRSRCGPVAGQCGPVMCGFQRFAAALSKHPLRCFNYGRSGMVERKTAPRVA